MKILKYAGFFPWVFIGSVIGSIFVVPMISRLIDELYYKNKYNKNAINYVMQYIDNSYTIKITMPTADSKLYLHNIDREKYPIYERFDTTDNSQNFFNNPSADYTSFYCKKYKKYMNIISFSDVNWQQ